MNRVSIKPSTVQPSLPGEARGPLRGRLVVLGGLAPPLPPASPSLRALCSAASPTALTSAGGPLVGDAPRTTRESERSDPCTPQ